jgi:hypothetical protein
VKKLNGVIRLLGIALLAAAVAQELRKPTEERSWHGKVGGIVPYDFRVPTMERIREAYWSPDNPRVFTDRVLGVGWGINIPSVFKWLREKCQATGSTDD